MRKRVLIVDDEKNIVSSIKQALEHEDIEYLEAYDGAEEAETPVLASQNYDIECLEAYDGAEGLRLAKKEKPDVVILDIMMPSINGYKVARLLKFDEKYKDIPIIMLTGRSQEKDVEIGKMTGADEYLTKPFYMAELIKLVNKYLVKNREQIHKG